MGRVVQIIWLLPLLLLVACGKGSNQDADEAGVSVSVLTIKTQPVDLQTQLPGRVRSYQEAEVRPQVTGILLKRSFTEGDIVTEGMSLYQIDPSLYEATLISTEADLQRARALVVSTKNQSDRFRELLKTNAVSQQNYDDAEAGYKEAVANVGITEAAVNTAKINLAFTQVRSPITGRIGISNVTPGALVTANQVDSLANIQQLDPINVEIVQSSAQLLRLKARLQGGSLHPPKNTGVRLILEDGSVYRQGGELQFAQVTVDENTDSVILRASFPNSDDTLLSGMYVRALVNTGTDPQAILVPQKAITRNARGEAIAMIAGTDNKVESRMVTTAEVIDNQWRIIDGLKVGDKLILDGFQKIQPGVKVKPEEFSEADEKDNVSQNNPSNK